MRKVDTLFKVGALRASRIAKRSQTGIKRGCANQPAEAQSHQRPADFQVFMAEQKVIKEISGGVVEKQINILQLEMVRQGNELSEKLGARIDAQGKELGARIDAQEKELGARIDAQGKELGARIDAQGKELGARIDAQGKELGARIEVQSVRIEDQGKDMSKGFQHMAERQLDHTRVMIGSVFGIAALFFGLNKYDSSEKRHVVGRSPPLESIVLDRTSPPQASAIHSP